MKWTPAVGLALAAAGVALGTTSSVWAKPYKGGEVYSSQAYQYGRIEMRMRMARGSGLLSTFFTYKDGSELTDTFWEEIDIEVLGQDDATAWQSNIITGLGTRTTSEQVHTHPFSLADDYHTYALEWTPDYVAWEFDGSVVRQTTGGQTGDLTSPQSLRFNIWAADVVSWVGAFDDAVLPQYQYVNWISYYRYEGGQFLHEWTDDFDTFDAARWGRADWTFAENLADFDPNNVVVQDGTLILALTHEGQTGFSGTVPLDSGGDTGGTGGTTGSGGAGVGGAAGSGGSGIGGDPGSGGAGLGGDLGVGGAVGSGGSGIGGDPGVGGAVGSGGSGTGGDPGVGGAGLGGGFGVGGDLVGIGGAVGTGGIDGTGGADAGCPEGLVDCGGVCVDLFTDGNHCGACATPCALGQVCNAGICAMACAAGLTQCGQDCVDLGTSSSHCGACQHPCALPGAVAACVAGSCVLQSCLSGSVDLDGAPETGCEYTCTFTGAETCNAVDDDCNGEIDEGTVCTAAPPADPAAAGSPGAPALSSEEDSGCGCRLAPRPGRSLASWSVLGLGLVGLIRRRRRPSRAARHRITARCSTAAWSTRSQPR